MHRKFVGLAVAFAFVTSSPAAAQDPGGSFGIGVGVSTFSVADFESLLMPSVYVPIRAGDQFLVEPSFGIIRVSDDDFTDTLLSLGAGLLYIMDATSNGSLYVGPRVGIIRFSESFGSSSDSETNLTLAGVVGGEYFLSPSFSLGGEAGLRWVDLSGGSMIATATEFRVRWYMP